MSRTLAENPWRAKDRQRYELSRQCILQSVFRRQEEGLVRLRIGVERSPGSVSNGVAVVQLVEQIVYSDSHCQPARRLRELDVNDGVRRHEAGKAVGLVVIVVLRADVTRYSAEPGFRSELPGEACVRFYAWNQGYDVAADIDAADRTVTKARGGQGNVREQRDRRGNRS